MNDSTIILIAVNVIGWAVCAGVAWQKLNTISARLASIEKRMEKGDDVMRNHDIQLAQIQERCLNFEHAQKVGAQ